MSLSKIEMVGFKSFMNPSAIALRPGVTAILGPNGCGKTNIVDAVRWVLGEQSARQLRGVKMENVIFNGTQTHKPLGAAVVNLTINNERGIFPLDYTEITVTRKLYRSGISEYFINKNPCRLKDVRELFADTGTGSHSYAVIEQEMIDWVLNDFHGERRLMFEEAAGIVKYRMRREEAQRKLALTDADLLRLDDIMDELAKQVRSLRYQMGKAKRYQIVRERIRRWEVIEIRRRLGDLAAGRRTAESELAGIADRSSIEDGSLGDLERGVQEARLLLVDIEKRNTELQNRRYEIRRTIQASEERLIQFTERRGEAERRIERARREIEEAEGRLERIAAKIAEAGRVAVEIEGRLGAEEGALGVLSAEFGSVAAASNECAARILDVKQTHLDFLQDRVRVESGLEHSEGLLRDLDAKAAETRGRITELERENRELGADRERKAAELAGLQERVAAMDRRRGELFTAIEETEKRLFDRERHLAELQADLARIRSRHDLMLRVVENYEGYPGGARHVLRRGDSRVRGPLGELLKVEDEHRSALEAVLAGLLDGVVVDRVATALEFVDELSRQKLGRIRFFAEEAIGAGESGAIDAPGSRGPLSSFVRGEGAARSLAERFLGGIHLFDDVEAALAFVTSEAGRGRGAVTRSGVYFAGGAGIYFAGSSGEEVSLLGRRDEIEKMKGEMERLEATIGAIAAECGEARSSKETLSAELQRLEAETRSIRGELAAKGE